MLCLLIAVPAEIYERCVPIQRIEGVYELVGKKRLLTENAGRESLAARESKDEEIMSGKELGTSTARPSVSKAIPCLKYVGVTFVS